MGCCRPRWVSKRGAQQRWAVGQPSDGRMHMRTHACMQVALLASPCACMHASDVGWRAACGWLGREGGRLWVSNSRGGRATHVAALAQAADASGKWGHRAWQAGLERLHMHAAAAQRAHRQDVRVMCTGRAGTAMEVAPLPAGRLGFGRDRTDRVLTATGRSSACMVVGAAAGEGCQPAVALHAVLCNEPGHLHQATCNQLLRPLGVPFAAGLARVDVASNIVRPRMGPRGRGRPMRNTTGGLVVDLVKRQKMRQVGRAAMRMHAHACAYMHACMRPPNACIWS